jgi:8-oxo-dGTP diphosphatase
MPRFCSSCGASIGAPAPIACRGCGAMHWGNAKPCAAALVVRDGKLLLTKRAIEPWLGLWCAPSGFCVGDEHPINAAEREALEETGVQVRVTGHLGIWIDEYASATAAGDDADHVAVAYYHAIPVGTETTAHDPAEVAEVSWFAPDDLPRDRAPPVNGARIFAAWRAAYEAGDLTTRLRDR